MGYGTDGLTFNTLREANIQRLPEFKNAKGEPANCHLWSLAQWFNAITGELGEAANIVKKIDRGDMTLDEARVALAKELADIQTYLDITAHYAGINLGEATKSKWNEVSKRIGCNIIIADDDWHYAK